MKDYKALFKRKLVSSMIETLLGCFGKNVLHLFAYPPTSHASRQTCEGDKGALVGVLDLLEEVLRSSSHPHLFDDFLVENCSFILQFTAASLSKWIASLSEKEMERKRLTTIYMGLGAMAPYRQLT